MPTYTYGIDYRQTHTHIGTAHALCQQLGDTADRLFNCARGAHKHLLFATHTATMSDSEDDQGGPETLLKIIFVGSSGVGKTSLIEV